MPRRKRVTRGRGGDVYRVELSKGPGEPGPRGLLSLDVGGRVPAVDLATFLLFGAVASEEMDSASVQVYDPIGQLMLDGSMGADDDDPEWHADDYDDFIP